MPPNTVDSATPLPPRRLAPWTPPVSSPAAKRPSTLVRQAGSITTPPIMKWAVGPTSTGPRARSRPKSRQRLTMPLKVLSTTSAPRCETSIHTPPLGVPRPALISRKEARATRSRVERRSEEHTSELQSHSDLVCRLLLEKKKGDVQIGAEVRPDVQ